MGFEQKLIRKELSMNANHCSRSKPRWLTLLESKKHHLSWSSLRFEFTFEVLVGHQFLYTYHFCCFPSLLFFQAQSSLAKRPDLCLICGTELLYQDSASEKDAWKIEEKRWMRKKWFIWLSAVCYTRPVHFISTLSEAHKQKLMQLLITITWQFYTTVLLNSWYGSGSY